jgi:hypothetical protein
MKLLHVCRLERVVNWSCLLDWFLLGFLIFLLGFALIFFRLFLDYLRLRFLLLALQSWFRLMLVRRFEMSAESLLRAKERLRIWTLRTFKKELAGKLRRFKSVLAAGRALRALSFLFDPVCQAIDVKDMSAGQPKDSLLLMLFEELEAD